MLTPSPSQLKIYEILKTDEQVKKLIEKLEFWTLCNYKPNPDTWRIKCICLWREHNSSNINLITKVTRHFIWNIDIKKLKWWQWFEIIWLPLSEHFIRLYCKNKNIDCNFNRKDLYVCSTEFVWKEFWIRLDNTKDFNSQSDECYNSICEALINL